VTLPLQNRREYTCFSKLSKSVGFNSPFDSAKKCSDQELRPHQVEVVEMVV
ncbi:5418_t:CDS:1, partial [Acaulospora morrowiae]